MLCDFPFNRLLEELGFKYRDVYKRSSSLLFRVYDDAANFGAYGLVFATLTLDT